MTPQSTTLEILLNGRLAELLRQQGLEAEAEQVLKDHKGNRHQIDVLVELEDQAVAIEAEFAPARTVQADARKRLPAKPLLWRGLPISSAFTLVYPQELQKRVESRARKELEERQDLEFAQFLPEEIHTQHQLFPEAAEAVAAIGATEGSVTTLAECLHSFWLRADSSNLVEQTIEEAATAIRRATECLRRSPDVHPHADADTDAAATSALPPFPLVNSASFGSARSRPGREAAKRTLDGEDRSGIIQGEGKGDSRRSPEASEPPIPWLQDDWSPLLWSCLTGMRE